MLSLESRRQLAILHCSVITAVYLVVLADVIDTASVYVRVSSLDNMEFLNPNSTKNAEDVGQCGTSCYRENKCFALTFTQSSKTCQLFYRDLSKDSTHVSRPGSVTMMKEDLSCENLKENKNLGSDLYLIYPIGVPEGLRVVCDQKRGGGGWMVIQRRFDGSEKFRRPFLDYENGFGNKTAEFWIGNKYLHAMTTAGHYKLRVDLWRFDGQSCYAEYSTFVIGSALSQYKLTVSGFTGTCGDGLSTHNGHKFYTIDNDSAVTCANRYNGGWWYHRCHTVNINGLYINEEISQYAPGVVWKPWNGKYTTLQRTEMKIKQI